jgi:RNA polymerase sigma-70 factor (sigma-E family)
MSSLPQVTASLDRGLDALGSTVTMGAEESDRAMDVDAEADLRAFVAARGASLSRAAFLLTGDHQAAEDLVQDTYVVMVRRLHKSGHVDPEAYVRRILYSRFIDTWRRRKLREVVMAALPAGLEPGASVDPTDRLTLSTALARLTSRQRAVVVLRFYEDLTEVQTAHVLGISVNTVKSQSRVALQRLRDLAPDILESFEGADS